MRDIVCSQPVYGRAAGMRILWPKTFITGDYAGGDPDTDPASTGIAWADPNNHSISLRGLDLETFWQSQLPMLWQMEAEWNFYDYYEPFANLIYTLRDSHGAVSGIPACMAFSPSGTYWSTENIFTAEDPNYSYRMNWYDNSKEFCGIEAHFEVWYSIQAVYPPSWSRGMALITKMEAHLDDSRFALVRQDLWNLQWTGTPYIFMQSGGWAPSYDLSGFMTNPLYYVNPAPPPAYLNVTRPWNQWQIRIASQSLPGGAGVFPECIMASGSISHDDWTPRQDGPYWADVWNPGTFVLLNPYPYFAAHGILPPYPASLIVRLEYF